jgi:hypothetical protein
MPRSRTKVARQAEVLVEFPPPPMSFQAPPDSVRANAAVLTM